LIVENAATALNRTDVRIVGVETWRITELHPLLRALFCLLLLASVSKLGWAVGTIQDTAEALYGESQTPYSPM
jgi:hypothetical protein